MPEYDGLRALCVMTVVFYHLHPDDAINGGWIGVDVFFVLSGYLITRILDKEYSNTGRIDFKRFYLKRLARLAPALLIMLATVAAISPFLGDEKMVSFRSILIALLYFSNWNMAFEWWGTGALSHTWTLSVEEQFYFVWPVLFVLGSRRRLPLLVLATMALSLWWRFHLQSLNAPWFRLDFGADTHCVSLLAGCFAALTNNQRLNRMLANCWLILLSGLAWCVWRHPVFVPMIQTQTIMIGTLLATLLILALDGRMDSRNVLSNPCLVYLGRISYGIYLWHAVIIYMLERAWKPATAMQNIGFDMTVLLTSIGIAACSFRFVELPVLAGLPRNQARPS